MLSENWLTSLANQFYPTPEHCLWEIVRNGWLACMPDQVWIPQRGRVEVRLDYRQAELHDPPTLSVVDFGSGLTDKKLEHFCSTRCVIVRKRPPNDSCTLHGAAWKAIGRFAALGLSLNSNNGSQRLAHVFSRAIVRGPVRHVEMAFDRIERHEPMLTKFVPIEDTGLDFSVDFQEPFTAIVVPRSVFGTYAEIKRALLWRVPRKKNCRFRLVIGDVVVRVPSLASRLAMVDQVSGVEVYVNRVARRQRKQRGGIWFTDLETCLRVTNAPALAHLLPEPMAREDLVGDVFVPGLLLNQQLSNGTGLRSAFLRSRVWRKCIRFLERSVVAKVRALLRSA